MLMRRTDTGYLRNVRIIVARRICFYLCPVKAKETADNNSEV